MIKRNVKISSVNMTKSTRNNEFCAVFCVIRHTHITSHPHKARNKSNELQWKSIDLFLYGCNIAMIWFRDFCSKYSQNCRYLRICSYLLKKYLKGKLHVLRNARYVIVTLLLENFERSLKDFERSSICIFVFKHVVLAPILKVRL